MRVGPLEAYTINRKRLNLIPDSTLNFMSGKQIICTLPEGGFRIVDFLYAFSRQQLFFTFKSPLSHGANSIINL